MCFCDGIGIIGEKEYIVIRILQSFFGYHFNIKSDRIITTSVVHDIPTTDMYDSTIRFL